MYKLLLDEPPLVILPSLAVRIGLNEAIVLQQVHYWLMNARESGRQDNYRNGRWWVYNSYPEWCKTFPFWSEPTVKRTFLNLEKEGMLLSGCFSDDRRDRRKWYTIDYDHYQCVVEGNSNPTKDSYDASNDAIAAIPDRSDASDQIDPMEQVTLIRCIGSKCSDETGHIDTVQQRNLIRSYIGTKNTAETTTKNTAAESGLQPYKQVLDDSAAALVSCLVEAGVNRADALRLATEHPEECRRQLEYLPFITEFTSTRGAYLRSAIEQGFGAPKAFQEAEIRKAKMEQEQRVAHAKQAKIEQKQREEQEAEARTAALKVQLMQDSQTWLHIQAEAEAKLPALLRGKPNHVAYGPALEAKINEIVAAMV